MSTPQNVATVVVFDYLLDTAGKPIVGATVRCVLNYNAATVSSPAVSIVPNQQSATTDANGYYQFTLIPSASLAPSGTTYQVVTPVYAADISVPSGGGPYQVPGLIVGQPTSLSAPATVLTGPLTVQNGPITFPNASLGVAALTGVLPLANGGTGSASQNFVDLTTAQSIAGNKTFTGNMVGTGGTTYKPGITSQVALTLQGLASQTGDLIQLLTSSAVVLWKVAADGTHWFYSHLVASGAAPTLGALQTGIASQSVVGNDICGTISVTTTATPPAAFSTIAILTYANSFAGVANTRMFFTNTSSNQRMMGFGQGSGGNSTGFTLQTADALGASTTYNIYYFVVGSTN